MTGYYISVGYNSAVNREDVWVFIKERVEYYCENPLEITKEVLRFEPDRIPHTLRSHVNAYTNCNDLTIQINEDEEGAEYICQAASSGSGDRGIKEACKRAFCRLILHDCHMKRYEICIHVV